MKKGKKQPEIQQSTGIDYGVMSLQDLESCKLELTRLASQTHLKYMRDTYNERIDEINKLLIMRKKNV